MAKQAGQKLKLLYLNKFLLENTDENHTVTINEIIEYLASVGISAERKSLYDDFENLRLFGTDILSIKQGGTTGYYVAGRTFEVSELKLLVDAVQVAKFITDKKSNQLIGKLETLCSFHEAQTLSRQVIIPSRIKSMNESIYYNVDKIHTAITNNLSITFKYFEKIQNDNSAFWDKNRKNWLHILTDDYAENYNRTPVYPEISEQYKAKMHEIMDSFKENRRGIVEE